MKARLVVFAVALALAIAGAYHLAHRGAPPAAAGNAAPPAQIEPMSVDPGGWWDWH